MRQLPRILAVMGSGETTPSMAPVHRALLARLGDGPVPATLLDTPYGFQENAADITSAAVGYFANRLRNPISVASFRRSDGEVKDRQTALARVRDADYVFSGPGSPSYALRQWIGSEIPGLLADKLAGGGALVMASAAALTLGRLTLPVYEIYKVGEDPHWLPGLDLLSAFGLPVAVIPHYDNAEGRGHDTRYCFLGERRLRELEAATPDDAFILGVDEHTTLVLDLGAGRASVRGRRGVTVRRRGRSTVFDAGSELTIDQLSTAAFARDAGASRPHATAPQPSPDDGNRSLGPRLAEYEQAFREGLARLDLRAAVRSVLAVDDLVAETRRSDVNETRADARIARRSMIVRLAEAAEAVTERIELVGPLTDALVAIRRAARTDGDWAAADTIRDTLRALGVELNDSAEGTRWSIRDHQPEGE